MDKFSQGLWRGIFTIIYKGWYGTKVYGRENVPKTGPAIIAPNHKSNNDPPICGYAIPRHPSFMAKEELFVKPISRWFCRWLGAFPVKRGTVDKIAIRHAMGILKEGELLGIFPEGGRYRKPGVGRFHDGAASLALRTGVPIIPVALIGTDKMEKNKTAAVIGKPIVVAKAKPTAEAIAAVNEQLREAILGLMDDFNSGRLK